MGAAEKAPSPLIAEDGAEPLVQFMRYRAGQFSEHRYAGEVG